MTETRNTKKARMEESQSGIDFVPITSSSVVNVQEDGDTLIDGKVGNSSSFSSPEATKASFPSPLQLIRTMSYKRDAMAAWRRSPIFFDIADDADEDSDADTIYSDESRSASTTSSVDDVLVKSRTGYLLDDFCTDSSEDEAENVVVPVLKDE